VKLQASCKSVRPLSSDGAIAQLGERLLCKQEVVGSIPSGSTRRFGLAAPLDRLCDLVWPQDADCRLSNSACRQQTLLVRAKSIRRVVDFRPIWLDHLAFVGGARVI
jgi:hypothetical protein